MAQQEATLFLKIKEVGQAILDRFVFTLGDVIDIAKNVAAALYSTVEAYREEEKAINQLTRAMIEQGTYTGDLRNKYIDQASALQELTLYGDEQIINAQRILQSMIGNREVSEELTRATLDLAAAKEMDLASAADLVGKTISSETNVLKRYGIEVENSADSGVKLQNVIDGLNSKFKGQAEAAAEGLGQVDQLEHVWSDFLEKVGALLAPFVIGLSKATAAAIKFASAVLPETFDPAKKSMQEINAEMDKVSRKLLELHEEARRAGPFAGGHEKSLIPILEARMAELQMAINKQMEMERQAAEQSLQIQREKNARLSELQQEKAIADQDRMLLENEMLYQTEAERLATQMRIIDQMIANEQSAVARKKLVKDRGLLAERLAQENAFKQELQLRSMFAQQTADLITASAELATAVGDSESKAVFLIQKAAALATTWILTQVAAAQALASIPYPANLAAAANIETIGYIKMGAIAATTIKGLAEGGIVQASPGGGIYQIGEGGRDEAVIPLPDNFDPDQGFGGGSTVINLNGVFLGDEGQAMEMARMIDRNLLKLRQRNESVSFDEDVS